MHTILNFVIIGYGCDILKLMDVTVNSVVDMLDFGQKIGSRLKGGEVLELVGDVGAGKTTFTKGLAKGLGVSDDVQSPTFTISRVYQARDGLDMAHYDFYRLNDPGILQMEIAESMQKPEVVTVIEWGGVVRGVLPADRLTISFRSPTVQSRQIHLAAGGKASWAILEAMA